MKRRSVLVAGVLAGAVAGLAGLGPAGSPASAASSSTGAGPTVYVGSLTRAQLTLLQATGVDRSELGAGPASAGKATVEVILDKGTAQTLVAKGVPLTEKKIGGVTASAKMRAEAAAAPTVFRSYSEPGGLLDEYTAVAKKYPAITKLETIGKTVKGQPIIALKVTKDAGKLKDGARPAVLYMSNQHAREWITPQMNRRLMHYFVDGYATDKTAKKLIDSTELWFVPSANPDGYDFTFTEGNRLWRKNLRDNNGDGQIGSGDGVDPNRNYPTKWNYDNEGSSSNPASETYRGTAPASEPETKAADGLLKRIKFKFMINYHSAAELLLYGVGWQVETRPRTTPSTRPRPGTTPTPPSPVTTRTSPPSSTPPTARPTTTPAAPTRRCRTRRRCPPVKRPARSTPAMRSTRPTARACSTSPTPNR